MKPSILKELKDTYSMIFDNDTHFTYLYGSQAYGSERNTSDLDLVTVVEEINPAKLQFLKGFVIGMHHKYGLEIDNEVPHDRKLITTFDMLSDAVKGKGFHYSQGNVIVPELEKTESYLLSDELMHRLLLNTITGKTLIISGDEEFYQSYVDEAWDTIIRVMFNIHPNPQNVPEFVSNMIRNNNREGESYMGYKDKPFVRSHLESEVSRRLQDYHEKGLLTKTDNTYMPKDSDFMDLPK